MVGGRQSSGAQGTISQGGRGALVVAGRVAHRDRMGALSIEATGYGWRLAIHWQTGHNRTGREGSTSGHQSSGA